MTGKALVAIDLGHLWIYANAQVGVLGRQRNLRPNGSAVSFDRLELRLPRLEVPAQGWRGLGRALARLFQARGRLARRVLGRFAFLHQAQLGLFLLGKARLHVLHLFAHLHQLARTPDPSAHQLFLTRAQPGAVRLALTV